MSFLTLGCKLNYAETSTYERKLLSGIMGSRISVVPWSAGADVYIVNTCSVTEHSDKKCRNIIRKLHRQSPEAAIFVTGCYAELKRTEIEALEGVRQVFGAKEKAAVVPAVEEYMGGNGSCMEGYEPDSKADCFPPSFVCHSQPVGTSVPEPLPCEISGSAAGNSFFGAYSTGGRTRSFLKVQDGCDFKCHYCTVPYARGESRNEPISKIVEKAHAIAGTGCREIVLTGVNTGDFGKSTGESFLELIRRLNDVPGIERYRISSIEPNLLTEETVDWIASGTRFLPHFHIPLQSGCDKVLAEMGRRYDTAAFAGKIEYIRKAFGTRKVFFGIDVIVGFPGESEEDFETTYRFLSEVVRPAFIHVFPYSRRPGTPAAEREDQVQDSRKTERVARLEELCGRLHREFVENCLGDRCSVLWESRSRNGMMSGYSENYIKVTAAYNGKLIGCCSDVVLTAENSGIDTEKR